MCGCVAKTLTKSTPGGILLFLCLCLLISLILSASLPHARASMTRPKRWFLERVQGAGGASTVIAKNSDGPLRKPNAANPLGSILSVSVPTTEQAGKYTIDEGVVVSFCAPHGIYVHESTAICTRKYYILVASYLFSS